MYSRYGSQALAVGDRLGRGGQVGGPMAWPESVDT
jgi:hypothetical protein